MIMLWAVVTRGRDAGFHSFELPLLLAATTFTKYPSLLSGYFLFFALSCEFVSLTTMSTANGEDTRESRKLSAIEPRPEGLPAHIKSRDSLPSLKELLSEQFRNAPLSRASSLSAATSSLPKLVCPGLSQVSLDGRVLKVYNICGKDFTMQAPIENETVTVFKRTTLSGRILSYRLKVIQEPEKARACGNGPRCKILHCLLLCFQLTAPSFCRSSPS